MDNSAEIQKITARLKELEEEKRRLENELSIINNKGILVQVREKLNNKAGLMYQKNSLQFELEDLMNTYDELRDRMLNYRYSFENNNNFEALTDRLNETRKKILDVRSKLDEVNRNIDNITFNDEEIAAVNNYNTTHEDDEISFDVVPKQFVVEENNNVEVSQDVASTGIDDVTDEKPLDIEVKDSEEVEVPVDKDNEDLSESIDIEMEDPEEVEIPVGIETEDLQEPIDIEMEDPEEVEIPIDTETEDLQEPIDIEMEDPEEVEIPIDTETEDLQEPLGIEMEDTDDFELPTEDIEAEELTEPLENPKEVESSFVDIEAEEFVEPLEDTEEVELPSEDTPIDHLSEEDIGVIDLLAEEVPFDNKGSEDENISDYGFNDNIDDYSIDGLIQEMDSHPNSDPAYSSFGDDIRVDELDDLSQVVYRVASVNSDQVDSIKLEPIENNDSQYSYSDTHHRENGYWQKTSVDLPIKIPSGEYINEDDILSALDRYAESNKGAKYFVTDSKDMYGLSKNTIPALKQSLKECTRLRLEESKDGEMALYGKIGSSSVDYKLGDVETDLKPGKYLNRNELLYNLEKSIIEQTPLKVKVQSRINQHRKNPERNMYYYPSYMDDYGHKRKNK